MGVDDGRGSAPDKPADFADWVRPELAKMTRLAARLAPNADRDDVVQEAMMRAWRKRDQARRARRRQRPFALLGEINVPSRSLEDRVDVEAAVGRLAKRQKLAVDCF